jgi:hypothetical protein
MNDDDDVETAQTVEIGTLLPEEKLVQESPNETDNVSSFDTPSSSMCVFDFYIYVI